MPQGVVTSRPPHRIGLSFVAAAVTAAKLVLGVPVSYLGILTAAAWFATLARRQETETSLGSRRFAILIPAHDEQQVISSTLRSLTSLDHPPDEYEVHVVADHCTDRTVELARAAGVEVHERSGARRGKGPALEWLVARVLAASTPRPDVFVVVDADTIVDPGLLSALDRHLRSGASVVQGQYRVHEPESSPSAGLRAAALALRHHVRPLGRTTIGASCGLYGNGMAFTSDVLAGRSWSNHLTEDAEMQLVLLLEGTLVAYAPDAIVEAVMPPTLDGARTQNERWEQGRLDLARRFVPQLLRSARRQTGRRRIAAADAVLDQLVPPLSVLCAAVAGVAAVDLAVGSLMRDAGRLRRALVLPGALAGHVVAGLVLARPSLATYRSLWHAPAMVLWKVRLWLRVLARPGSVQWIRTSRQGAT